MLLGFPLVMASHSVLILVRQVVPQDNCSISVSSKQWKISVILENKITFFKNLELGQETLQTSDEVLHF